VKKKTKTVEIVKGKNLEKAEVTSYEAVASSGKSQIAALLLCWFVGVIGVHRFYLGYTWQGIVQILTLGGLGIWTLIDFIRIIIGDLQPKNGSYSKTF
jgi:TM2 domain-containing membrane protein YozV